MKNIIILVLGIFIGASSYIALSSIGKESLQKQVSNQAILVNDQYEDGSINDIAYDLVKFVNRTYTDSYILSSFDVWYSNKYKSMPINLELKHSSSIDGLYKKYVKYTSPDGETFYVNARVEDCNGMPIIRFTKLKQYN